MAINRYDTPAQYNYINPLPFNELLQAGAYRQKRFEDTDLLESQLQEQANPIGLRQVVLPDNRVIQLEDGDYDISKQWADQFNKELEQVANKVGTTDKSSQEYIREVRKLANSYKKAISPEGVLGKAQRNIEAYKKYQDILRENPDLSQDPWRANQLTKSLLNYTQNPSSILETGFGISDKVDRSKELDDMMQGINSEIVKLYSGSDGAGYIKEGKLEKISNDKISAAASNLIANSVIAQDLKAEYDYYRMLGVDGKQAEELINKKQQSLIDAMVAKYRKTTGTASTKVDTTYWKLRSQQEKLAELLNPTTSLTYGTKNSALQESLIPEYDDKGLPKQSNYLEKTGTYSRDLNEAELIASAGPFSGGSAVRYSASNTPIRELNEEKIKEDKELLDNMIYYFDKSNPDKRNLTRKQKLDFWKDARDNYKNVPVEVFDNSVDWIKNRTKQLASTGNLQNLLEGKWVVPIGTNKKRQGEKVNREEFYDNHKKFTDVDIKDPKLKISVNGITKRNPYGMPGALEVQISDSKGNGQTLLVSASGEEQRAFTDISQVTNAMYSALPEVPVTLSDGREVLIINTPTGIDQNPFKHTIKPRTPYVDSNGEVHTEFNPEQFINDLYQLRTVPYLKQFIHTDIQEEKD